MCGRYTYFSSAEILKKFDLEKNKESQLALDLPDNYNVSPGSEMPVIIRGEQQHKLEFMIWGLVPSWSKTSHSDLKLINARQEGLLDKPMWKRLIKSKRCIVPARGFYEWKVVERKKVPYYITPMHGDVLSFAGLWDMWHDDTGTELYTYTIITTSPNKEMKNIHKRMPAILDKQQSNLWLEPTDLSRAQLDDLFKPIDNTLKIDEVNTKVNYAGNNSQDLIYPLDSAD